MTDAQWEAYLTEKVGLDEKDTDARTEYTDKIKKLNINSAADWEAYLDTIALRPGTDAWDNYVQDVLDLIEYANGDATTSYWARCGRPTATPSPLICNISVWEMRTGAPCMNAISRRFTRR